MSRRTRMWTLAVGALGVAVLLVWAYTGLPHFGQPHHPYGDRAVQAALSRRTANVISSVNFDQRAFDTLGEESILFGAVLGTVVLLRRTRDERTVAPRPAHVRVLVRRYGILLLPVTFVAGIYIVAHGQLSPGGGFQGGVVVATALHLLYIAVDYRALERIRPLAVHEIADAAGEGAYLMLGLAGTLAGTSFLANFLPLGTFNSIASAGTVPLLNAAIGVEVASAVVVLLARFLDQAVELEQLPGAEPCGDGQTGGPSHRSRPGRSDPPPRTGK